MEKGLSQFIPALVADVKKYEMIKEKIKTAVTCVLDKMNFDDDGKDGRVSSLLKEEPFLDHLKDELALEEFLIEIPKSRHWYDIKIDDLHINLKITSLGIDNCCTKKGIFFSYTGYHGYPESSTWNNFYDALVLSKELKKIKEERNQSTEYHYLVIDKKSHPKRFLLKSIFDIHTSSYVANASNNLQINWKNEFEKHLEYFCDDYKVKQQDLYNILKLSVKKSIETKQKMANNEFKFN